jgi:hypothetical protein
MRQPTTVGGPIRPRLVRLAGVEARGARVLRRLNLRVCLL